MNRHGFIIIASLLVLIAVAYLIGVRLMTTLALNDRCRQVSPDEWSQIAANFERRPITHPEAPYSDIEFLLDTPFSIKSDDILIFEAYAPEREINQIIHDGPVPSDRRVRAKLAVDGENAVDVYWLGIRVLRPSVFTACRWGLEERFELPFSRSPTRWRLEILPERIPTDDGGSRTTRISPL